MNSEYETVGAALGGLAAIMGMLSLIATVASIIMIVSQWIIYKKAGQKGWASIVPIYNMVVLLKIVELPVWYIFLLIIPFANIYATFKIYIELAHKFGQSTGFGVASVFFNIICFPILAFSKNVTYKGSNNEVNNNSQTANQPYTPGSGFTFQAQTLNDTTNNMNQNNTVNPQPIMFNQNINTEISPINTPQNTNINEQPSGTNIVNTISEPVNENNITFGPVQTANDTIPTNNVPVQETPNQPSIEPINNPMGFTYNAPIDIPKEPEVIQPVIPQPIQTPQQMPIQGMPNQNTNTQSQPLNVIPGMNNGQEQNVQNQNNGPINFNNQNM